MSERQFDSCQCRGCERSASGRYTRPMYAAEDGETWPEDVCPRPVCWRHHYLEELIKSAIIGFTFGVGVSCMYLFWVVVL
jgi:hypothetical protein